MNTVQILQSSLADIFIEDYDLYCNTGDYFITITLKPEEYKKPIYTQLKSTINEVQQILKLYCTRYILLPEITSKNNIHYHGLIKFNKFVEYPINQILDAFKYKSSIGFVMINDEPIKEDNRQRTWTYLFKEINKTISIIYHYRKKKVITFDPYLKNISSTQFNLFFP